MRAWHSQDRHVVRLEWGPVGGVELVRYAVEAGSAVCAVVVDVLSFTTSVSVAMDRGMTVHPYRWADDGAEKLARERQAVLARRRSHTMAPGQISLSPGTIRVSDAARIVLPSPNGSTLTTLLHDAGATVVAASLRNRRAVAHWLVDRLRSARHAEPVIILVPAGERWADDSLRPAVEDLWGAGAVASAVVGMLEHQAGPLLLSPEAELAVTAYASVAERLAGALSDCASGRELIEHGFPEDVTIAAELDASPHVPLLEDGAYVRAGAATEGALERARGA